ncbi:MAG: hypothetical protein ABSF59_05730 [Candidatus Sulfotelmatobacter sp.]|jgi:hypothetical protein
MSKTNRNFVIAYFLLVGLPILGLVGVLKSGRNLTAPISVDGVWQLQADPAQLAASPCGQALASRSDATTFAISQSGKTFLLGFGSVNPSNGSRSVASGTIDGTRLRASLPANSIASAPDGGCGQGRELTLAATVNPKTDPRSLAGTFSIPDCPSCASIEFHAVRLAASSKKGPL